MGEIFLYVCGVITHIYEEELYDPFPEPEEDEENDEELEPA